MNIIILSIIFGAILVFILVKIMLSKTKKEMNESFKSLSYDILMQNSKNFVELAKAQFDKYQIGMKSDIEYKKKELENVLAPLKEAVENIDKYTKDVEKQRLSAYSSLNKQIEILSENEKLLRQETINLSKALKSPGIKGSWGQVHLRRVVELAGLLNNCDFYEQKTVFKDDKMFRPDLVVRLPGNKNIIVDAKTPIEAFLEAHNSIEDVKENKLKAHSLSLKKHVLDLSSKEYQTKFEFAFEYVILFVPAEAILSAALKNDPTILEMAASKNIIIATPTILLAILKTIAQLWKEENISKNIREIAKTGKELYERLSMMSDHFLKLGKNLSISVDAYNQTVASFNTRVMVSAKKLKNMGLGTEEKQIEELSKTCNVGAIKDVK